MMQISVLSAFTSASEEAEIEKASYQDFKKAVF